MFKFFFFFTLKLVLINNKFEIRGLFTRFEIGGLPTVREPGVITARFSPRRVTIFVLIGR